MQRTRGFTLIEVMLVIVVLALLIGLLIPAVGRMREAASRASARITSKKSRQPSMPFTTPTWSCPRCAA